MVKLRKIEPEDVVWLYQWENDAAAWADGSNHNPLSRKDLRDYIESSTGDIYRDGQLRLVIETKEGQTVGCVDLFDLDVRNRRAAIGLYIERESRGKGYAKEALEELEEYGFGFLKLRVMYAIVGVKNEACRRVFEQRGYVGSSELKGWTIEDDAKIYLKIKD